jgi:hypothetical protein
MTSPSQSHLFWLLKLPKPIGQLPNPNPHWFRPVCHPVTILALKWDPEANLYIIFI